MSEFVQIPNHPNYAISKDGRVMNAKRGVMMTTSPRTKGGPPVVAISHNNKAIRINVDKLISQTFPDLPPQWPERVTREHGGYRARHIGGKSAGIHKTLAEACKALVLPVVQECAVCEKLFRPSHINKRSCSEKCAKIKRTGMMSKDKTGGVDFAPILHAQHAEFYALVRPRRSLRKRHCLRCRKSITTIDARMCTDCRAIVNRSAVLAQGF